MAINKRYTYVWHTGETATPFTATMKDAYGVARTDIASATFTLVNTADGEVLIDDEDCQSVSGGVLTYRPTADDMATACRFLAQFTVTITGTGLIEPSIHIEGEIEQSL